MWAAVSGATFGREYYLSSAAPDRPVDSLFQRASPSPDPLEHAVLASSGFCSPSVILRPEPPQGSFQLGESETLRSGRQTSGKRRIRFMSSVGMERGTTRCQEEGTRSAPPAVTDSSRWGERASP